MPQVSMVDVEGTGFQRVVSHWPEARDGIWALYEKLIFTGSLDVELKEQIRRTLANSGSCAFCASLGEATPATKLAVRRGRLAVGFAEEFSRNPGKVDASALEGLRKDFSDAEIVELVVWCSWCVFGQNIGSALGVEPATAGDIEAFRAWQRSGAKAG